MLISAIIAAAGRSERMGGRLPKQLIAIGGRPLLERSVAAFLAHPAVDELVVAVSEDIRSDPPVYLTGAVKPIRVVAGGRTRQESVASAFRAASDRAGLIVVHDAARPFASADLISRTIAAALECGAALAAVRARDTVKQSLPDTGSSAAPADMYVSATLPRESIFLAQTPQAFRRDVLARALTVAEREGVAGTDEAALAERAGYRVRIVDGEAANIKVTTPDDIAIAEAIAAELDGSAKQTSLPPRTGRAGSGYDLHRLVKGRPLVLGGVIVPSESGALGHSDADVVCHAVIDAILGAGGLGDIGRHFPDSDPRWKDASSLDLLARAAALLADHGYEVGNVDVTVVLEAPKIRDHIEAMRAAVAHAVGVDPARVSIKGKTNEGVDAIGRGEAIAAYAVALVRSRGSR